MKIILSENEFNSFEKILETITEDNVELALDNKPISSISWDNKREVATIDVNTEYVETVYGQLAKWATPIAMSVKSLISVVKAAYDELNKAEEAVVKRLKES